MASSLASSLINSSAISKEDRCFGTFLPVSVAHIIHMQPVSEVDSAQDLSRLQNQRLSPGCVLAFGHRRAERPQQLAELHLLPGSSRDDVSHRGTVMLNA